MARTRQSIKTPEFRGSFVTLDKPRKRDEDSEKEQYSIAIVLPKNKASTKQFIADLKKLIQEASAEKHGAPGLPEKKLKHFPIKDGDESENEQFQGCWIINAASNFKPSCIDKHGDELTTRDDLYSGAWYKAKISAWAWASPKFGKGVSINLESVIKTKDDTRFGGGSNAKDDFSDELENGESGESGGEGDGLL